MNGFRVSSPHIKNLLYAKLATRKGKEGHASEKASGELYYEEILITISYCQGSAGISRVVYSCHKLATVSGAMDGNEIKIYLKIMVFISRILQHIPWMQPHLFQGGKEPAHSRANLLNHLTIFVGFPASSPLSTLE